MKAVINAAVGVAAGVWGGLATCTQATAGSVLMWYAPWRCLQWGWHGWEPVLLGLGVGLALLAFMVAPMLGGGRDASGFGTRAQAKRAGLGGTRIVFGQWK